MVNEADANDPALGDIDIPDNYIAHILKNQANWYNDINWKFLLVLVFTPITGIIGAYHTKLRWETLLFSIIYHNFSSIGITAGYHRLWSHGSYNASQPLQYFLALMGAGAVQGSIYWWSRGHRAHHRYIDTDLDPIGSHQGLYHTHIGWLLIKPQRKPGPVDVNDLRKSVVVQWQQRNYATLVILMTLVVPVVIPWLLWGDAKGGFVYAGLLRLVTVHHTTFCVNSLAHHFGDKPFDDRHSPCDNFIVALITLGEGYHNYHHQFPIDYRNAIKWYQYDPTKWFIWSMQQFGFASHLKVFPDNEVRKGELTMQLKKLYKEQEALAWPIDVNDLPVLSWDSFQEQARNRPLVFISGFIHDVSDFVDEHAGGPHLIINMIGKDATTAFFGGVHHHSNTAQDLLAMKRVGILEGGHPHGFNEGVIPPIREFKIMRTGCYALSKVQI